MEFCLEKLRFGNRLSRFTQAHPRMVRATEPKTGSEFVRFRNRAAFLWKISSLFKEMDQIQQHGKRGRKNKCNGYCEKSELFTRMKMFQSYDEAKNAIER